MNWSDFESRAIRSVVIRSTLTLNVGCAVGAGTCAAGAACACTVAGRDGRTIAHSSAKTPAVKNLAVFRMVLIITCRSRLPRDERGLADFDAFPGSSVWLYPIAPMRI